MSHPVIAIGLDAADPGLIERWMAAGHLPNLYRLRQRGSYGHLDNCAQYAGVTSKFSCTEPLWVMFSTGCLPQKTGFWDTVQYDPAAYTISCDKITGGYDYQDCPPFYALGEDYRVALFDIPVSALSEQVRGLQILGWGGHFPFTPSHSNPPELLPQIIERYRKNPVLHKDHGSWWSTHYQQWLAQALDESIAQRVDICLDLMARDNWDLFIAVFGESHSAGHDFYHLSQKDHPLYEHTSSREDPMLATYQRIDQALGQLLQAAPKDAYILCFSLHGMAANHQDTLSMMFLGEILYRFNFPGKHHFGGSNPQSKPPARITSPLRGAWHAEVWRQVCDPNPLKRLASTWLPSAWQSFNQGDLDCPHRLEDNLHFMPALWYRSCWPKMRAFALPSFSNGHIRINLAGRDAQGMVQANDYDLLCEALTAMLYQLRNARDGSTLVESVLRTRSSDCQDGPEYSDADLVVVWHERVVDVVDHPDLGRIGPITLFRPGGHRSRGFVIAQGPGIPAHSDLPSGHAVDLAPTILQLMGAQLPDYFDGKSLLENRLNANSAVIP